MNSPSASCRLCGSPLPGGGDRCPSCGLAVATALSRAAAGRLATGLAVLYALTAVAVAISRSH